MPEVQHKPVCTAAELWFLLLHFLHRFPGFLLAVVRFPVIINIMGSPTQKLVKYNGNRCWLVFGFATAVGLVVFLSPRPSSDILVVHPKKYEGRNKNSCITSRYSAETRNSYSFTKQNSFGALLVVVDLFSGSKPFFAYTTTATVFHCYCLSVPGICNTMNCCSAVG